MKTSLAAIALFLAVSAHAAITITAQPSDAVACPGANVTFSISATGETPLSYAWYRGESGDTSSSAFSTQTSATISYAGPAASVWCRVTGPSGSVDSRTATVTPPPNGNVSRIYVSPLSSGYALTVYVADMYLPSVTLAWYRGAIGDTSQLIGQAMSVGVYPTQATTYWVFASGVGGTCGAIRSVILQP